MVSQDAYGGVDDRSHHAGDEQYAASHSTVESEHVGVELQLEDHHHLERKVGTGVSQRVANLLAQ